MYEYISLNITFAKVEICMIMVFRCLNILVDSWNPIHKKKKHNVNVFIEKISSFIRFGGYLEEKL
jgi:hypothetical protein